MSNNEWRAWMRRTAAKYLSPLLATALAVEAGAHPEKLLPHVDPPHLVQVLLPTGSTPLTGVGAFV